MSTTHVWLQQYPSEVPAQINPDAHASLSDMYATCFKQYKDKYAFSYMGKKITYGQMDGLCSNFAAYLQSIGMKPGDRIAFMLPNMLQYPIALFGALRAGMVVVNTNPLYTASLDSVLAGQPQWRKVCDVADEVTGFAFRGDDLYLQSTHDTPNAKILKTSMSAPDIARASTVVPEGKSACAQKEIINTESEREGV